MKRLLSIFFLCYFLFGCAKEPVYVVNTGAFCQVHRVVRVPKAQFDVLPKETQDAIKSNELFYLNECLR